MGDSSILTEKLSKMTTNKVRRVRSKPRPIEEASMFIDTNMGGQMVMRRKLPKTFIEVLKSQFPSQVHQSVIIRAE